MTASRHRMNDRAIFTHEASTAGTGSAAANA